MHVLIAPNAFKNSLSAEAAAQAIQRGLEQSMLSCTCECFPIGDGGDGTGHLLIKKCGGTRVEAVVHDPLGKAIRTSLGLIDQGVTAVIEMADASGLRLLRTDQLNPLRASSAGTGELIRLALDKGVKKIIIGMGGSATVDGGTGILKALGVRFLDAAGETLQDMPESLTNLASVDTIGIDPRIFACEVIVLCDVDNMLLGEQGSAAVFGPQKGASPEAVKKLDAALARLSAVALRQTGIDMSAVKYGGTAGGAAAGLHVFLKARLVHGIDHFLQLTRFEQALEKSDLVITGEGSIDEQTLQGKGPFGVAMAAKRKNIPVIGLAGKVPLEKSSTLQQYFDMLLSIGNEPTDLTSAMKHTAANLTRTAWEVGNSLSLNFRR
ncbi:glycerate kinase [Fulvivirgaceae bacterium PWU4]|uniref:Glycerate kinase n=1 Tax=Chryseosolibacter histidini TaxID=2782349 RepID=A0AAP2GN15_9BACT|nr:glycerate kinase [Chryseosolibacter histidini]MBT1697538.1 glycerate kinase [Chryseosolibacter histidini]